MVERREEVDIQRFVKESVVEILPKEVVLSIAVAAEDLGVKLEVILGQPLGEIIQARSREMAEIYNRYCQSSCFRRRYQAWPTPCSRGLLTL